MIDWILSMFQGSMALLTFFSIFAAGMVFTLMSLVFGGANGMLHADQGRIVVTRRLFRSGESEQDGHRLGLDRDPLADAQIDRYVEGLGAGLAPLRRALSRICTPH